MTNHERFNIAKSYGATLISEIDKSKKSIRASFEEYDKNLNSWDKVRVDNWFDSLKIKREYLDFLNENLKNSDYPL
jgi:hypothetical protein